MYGFRRRRKSQYRRSPRSPKWWSNRKRQTEREFQAEVVKMAEREDWLVFYVKNSEGSPRGWPDLFMARDGRLLAAELKVGDNQTTAEQDRWLRELRSGGVRAYVWRETDWQAIRRELNK